MAKKSGLKNAPSTTGNPSGGNRGNNPPAKPSVVKSNSSKTIKK
jgi:hypothetical protein